MKIQLTTIKRLSLSAALAATISFGLLSGQPAGTGAHRVREVNGSRLVVEKI